MTRVFISPLFGGDDQGEGGVRRTVELQQTVFAQHGIEVVERDDEADLILVHIEQASQWLRSRSGVPVIADCHGFYWNDVDPNTGAPYVWERWAHRANSDVMETIREADGVIAHSQWVAQAIRRHTMRDVAVIPHAVDLDAWQLQDAHDGYVLWNKNRPDPICDPSPIFDLAFAMRDVQFMTTFSLEDQNAPPNLTVTGRIPFADARRQVERAGVYLCTVRETFGVGTLEALACGVPVVGWNWGGQREFLRHKQNAWLCSPGDVDGLIEGIRWALANREELRLVSRETAEAFSFERVGKMYAAYLASALARWQEAHAGPRTSVIVTAYNLERYLPACLDSVLAQTDSDWECIVVDDASPDGCGRIAEEYASRDSRFRVIHNEDNLYLAGARNAGIEQARGRYILPLDADDMLGPIAVEVLAGALDADRSLHITYGNVRFVDEDGATPTDYQVAGQDAGHSGWPMAFRYEWQEQQRNMLPYSSMFRREVWRLTGGYRTRCRTAEDADFWLRAASYGFRPRMVTEADCLIYRNRADSMSREAGQRDWAAWFPWSRAVEARPAGALTIEQTPVHSCDPPTVSVIIPVGPGHEALLWDAVDSVDAQTFRQWECIVYNDTGAPLPRALPSWVRVIDGPSGQHVGVAAARNRAIAQARANLFLPLDADDYLQPDALAQLLAARQEAGGSVIVYSDWYDEKTPAVREVFQAADFDPTTYMQHMRERGVLHAVTALYQKTLWTDVGGFDEQLPAWEDWDFQLAAMNIGVCSVRVPQPLWVYRKHTGRRREENYADFERSKEGILAKWREYFNGRSELMGCQGCGGARAASPPPMSQQPTSAQAAQQLAEAGAALIEYTGPKEGNRQFRAPSGTIYTFGGGQMRSRYVRGDDVEHFLSMGDFVRQAFSPAQARDAAPELLAEGPPARPEAPPDAAQPPSASEAALGTGEGSEAPSVASQPSDPRASEEPVSAAKPEPKAVAVKAIPARQKARARR